MKKQNPIYIFTTLLSLGIAAFVLFLLVNTFGIPIYVIIIVFLLVIGVFFMYVAKKVSENSIENKFQRLKECKKCKSVIPQELDVCPNCATDLRETVDCEYCGHSNKIGSSSCEKCNGLIV